MMSVDMGLKNKVTGEYRVVPIATLSGFYDSWLPLCERLGLEWVSLFAGGALTVVPTDAIPEIVRELRTMADEIENTPESQWIADTIEAVLNAFAETHPTEWEYNFG